MVGRGAKLASLKETIDIINSFEAKNALLNYVISGEQKHFSYYMFTLNDIDFLIRESTKKFFLMAVTLRGGKVRAIKDKNFRKNFFSTAKIRLLLISRGGGLRP